MSDKLSLNSPFVFRYYAWIAERFPLSNGILFFVLYLTAAAFGRHFIEKSESLFELIDIAGCVASWTFFLLLRIYDEHKDYELDCKNYPERVLQKGLITLKHLKISAVICFLFQLSFCLYLDRGVGPVTLTWLVVTAWSFLMTMEFFVGEWLSERLLLYAISHMVIMPMIIYWLVAMGIGSSPFAKEINLLALLSFLSGFSFEITRKNRGPEEERDTVDSYSKILGIKGACALIIFLLLGIGFTGNQLLDITLNFQSFVVGRSIMFGLIGLAITHLIYFSFKPSKRGREINEPLVGVSMLSVYGMLIWAFFRI